MEAKALADKLVEAGILVKHSALGYRVKGDQEWLGLAEYCITDWRVAGKCLEAMLEQEDRGYDINLERDRSLYLVAIRGWTPDVSAWTDGNSLPRAIVEAFCEARRRSRASHHSDN